MKDIDSIITAYLLSKTDADGNCIYGEAVEYITRAYGMTYSKWC